MKPDNTVPTLPEDSIHPPQSSSPDPAEGLRELVKSDKTIEELEKQKQQIEEMISDFCEDSISYGEELHTGRVKSDDEIKSDSDELLRKQTEIAEAIDRLVTEAKGCVDCKKKRCENCERLWQT